MAEVDLKIIDGLIEFKKKELEKLDIELSNLNAQIHTQQVRREQDKKIDASEMATKFAEEKRKIDAEQSKLDIRLRELDLKEQDLRNRDAAIKIREQDVVDYDKKRLQLSAERSNFLKYKYDVELELVGAKNTIAEANETQNKIKMDRDMLDNREKQIKEKEKFWNDRIGELQDLEKKLETQRLNMEALENNKQVEEEPKKEEVEDEE